eukprot:TRINITY_DN15410_c0_g1_i5.p1 TRINITY_DN15410_c0_g1~~TRINITY_DN15410_c0_g1_i5.p1  ORF type:complete len:313 (+),score=9.59 TRINITY_DN15410_c0_g1_i5:75-1013(+)
MCIRDRSKTNCKTSLSATSNSRTLLLIKHLCIAAFLFGSFQVMFLLPIGCMPFYLLYLCYMYTLQSKVLAHLAINSLSLSFHIFYLVQVLLFFLILRLWPAFIYRREDVEVYIKRYRKDIKHLHCRACNLTKPMRSYHCVYCKTCIAKWQEHSYYFNKCIDARNCFVYWLYLLICLIINMTSLGSCFYYNDIRTKKMPKAFLYIVLLLIQLITLSKEFLKYTRSVAMNMTLFEQESWKLLIYMWKNDGQDFFNPFNRGILHNFLQSLKSTFTPHSRTSESLELSVLCTSFKCVYSRRAVSYTHLTLPTTPYV